MDYADLAYGRTQGIVFLQMNPETLRHRLVKLKNTIAYPTDRQNHFSVIAVLAVWIIQIASFLIAYSH